MTDEAQPNAGHAMFRDCLKSQDPEGYTEACRLEVETWVAGLMADQTESTRVLHTLFHVLSHGNGRVIEGKQAWMVGLLAQMKDSDGNGAMPEELKETLQAKCGIPLASPILDIEGKSTTDPMVLMNAIASCTEIVNAMIEAGILALLAYIGMHFPKEFAYAQSGQAMLELRADHRRKQREREQQEEGDTPA